MQRPCRGKVGAAVILGALTSWFDPRTTIDEVCPLSLMPVIFTICTMKSEKSAMHIIEVNRLKRPEGPYKEPRRWLQMHRYSTSRPEPFLSCGPVILCTGPGNPNNLLGRADSKPENAQSKSPHLNAANVTNQHRTPSKQVRCTINAHVVRNIPSPCHSPRGPLRPDPHAPASPPGSDRCSRWAGSAASC